MGDLPVIYQSINPIAGFANTLSIMHSMLLAPESLLLGSNFAKTSLLCYIRLSLNLQILGTRTAITRDFISISPNSKLQTPKPQTSPKRINSSIHPNGIPPHSQHLTLREEIQPHPRPDTRPGFQLLGALAATSRSQSYGGERIN